MKRLFSALFSSHTILGVALLALLLGFYSTNHPLLERLRSQTFDFYQQLSPRDPEAKAKAAEVIIIDIDDAALEKYGQWPWPRTLIARLVDRLMDYQAAVVGFDAIFSEPDRLSPPLIARESPSLSLETRYALSLLPENEAVLAAALKKGRVVLGHAGMHSPMTLDNLPRKVGFAYVGSDPLPWLYRYPGLLRNLPVLEENASGIGLFSFSPDADGVVRKVPLIERVGDQIFPSLSLEMLRVALGGKDDYFIKSRPEGGIRSIVVKNSDGGGFEIPTTQNGKVWVHFARHAVGKPLYISAKDVLDGALPMPSPEISGKLAIVGTSAIGLKDIRATPVNGNTPGVEVHAQVLENVLAQTHLTRPDAAIFLEAGMILVGGILLIFLVPRLSAVWNFLLSAALMGGLASTAWHYYTASQELVDAAYPSIGILLMFLTLTYLNYMREEKERRQVRTAFSHYVSPALLAELAADPSKLKLGGETRHITLLFSDIRGFTGISEQFDAEGLTGFINSFLTPMTDVIMAEKGTIDKYMGDAIMAFWNAPLAVSDHPVLACTAALKMLKAAELFNKRRAEADMAAGRKHLPINIGIGLNTGDCCVGNMGSDQRFDYSALGDHVNLASRLEGQSKTYGVGIVISEYTRAELPPEAFATMELDLLQVKGKTEPVRIFTVLGNREMTGDGKFTALHAQNEAMLAAYRAQEFGKAEEMLSQMHKLWPTLEGYYALYAERIAEFRKVPPPPGWNGVFVATSK